MEKDGQWVGLKGNMCWLLFGICLAMRASSQDIVMRMNYTLPSLTEEYLPVGFTNSEMSYTSLGFR